MNPDQKLALLTQVIKDAGMKALVMSGHAVRYYGIDRNTSDFDMVAKKPNVNAIGRIFLYLKRFETHDCLPKPLTTTGLFERWQMFAVVVALKDCAIGIRRQCQKSGKIDTR